VAKVQLDKHQLCRAENCEQRIPINSKCNIVYHRSIPFLCQQHDWILSWVHGDTGAGCSPSCSAPPQALSHCTSVSSRFVCLMCAGILPTAALSWCPGEDLLLSCWLLQIVARPTIHGGAIDPHAAFLLQPGIRDTGSAGGATQQERSCSGNSAEQASPGDMRWQP